MKRWTGFAVVATLAPTFTVGCVGFGPEDGRLGAAIEAVESDNAMSPNALSPNALSPNALSPNALSPNALSPNALSPNALLAIQDPGPAGELSRQHLKYTVSCALDDDQSFSFSWTDDLGVVHAETYWGLLGLATNWATRPLGDDDQRWISACLAARTNYYGVSVTISARGRTPPLNKHNTPEASVYTKEEGAFWGNLYASVPALYSCHVAENDDNSRGALRDCAAGHLDPITGAVSSCGMIQRLGTCDTYCSPYDGQWLSHASCWSDPSDPTGTASAQPITVALP